MSAKRRAPAAGARGRRLLLPCPGVRADRRVLVSCLLVVVAAGVALAAAELTEAAAGAFQRHADDAQREFERRATQEVGDSTVESALRAGRVVAGPGSGDGISGVRGGLVHHWRARLLIPGTTLDGVLRLARAYPEYPTIFRPMQAARVLSEDGDRFVVQFRMQESAGGLSATLDMRSDIVYTRLDARHVYVVSRSEEIREVRNAGRPGETLLPEGRDSGYLWRARALTRYVEDAAGVWMEMETLGLSRPYPPLFGWMIEPIARRVGRRSAETSLEEFRRAVLGRGERAASQTFRVRSGASL